MIDLKDLIPHATPRQAECILAIQKYGSQARAAEVMKIHPTTVRDLIKYARKRAARYGVIDPEDDGKGIPPPGFHLGKRTVQRNADGEVERVWDRHHPTIIKLEEAAETILERLSVPRARKLRPPAATSPRVHLQCIGDTHVGMLAYGAETGHGDYSVSIAREKTLHCTHELLNGGPACERAYVFNAGDWYHTDNKQGITARGGNVLDTDTRYSRMFDAGFELAVEVCDANLLKHQQVTYAWVPGNHDEITSWFMSKLLAAHYADEPRLDVMLSPRSRRYATEGCNLLGFAHGEHTKQAKLPALMALEHQGWNTQEHQRRIWLTGHRHHQETVNLDGCIIETFETVANPDVWHTEKGFVGSKRGMRSIILPLGPTGLIQRNESWL